MSDQYLTLELDELRVGDPLPGPVFVYLDFRFLTFRGEGDIVDHDAYDRLQLKKVRYIFIRETDRTKFAEWAAGGMSELPEPRTRLEQDFQEVRREAKRKMLDIFHASHPNKVVAQSLAASKKLVAEVMKAPYAVKPLAQLQTFSRGSVDHSVNVSILSVYLAMQMGYSHALILQHVGGGALLHDVGKSKVPIEDNDPQETIDVKMEEHPELGWEILEAEAKVPEEVRMIVAQHHENHDGSGFPGHLRGSGIYDLARIVSIANVFDELVTEGAGSLADRHQSAIQKLDQELSARFDPMKLEKALKILKLGL